MILSLRTFREVAPLEKTQFDVHGIGLFLSAPFRCLRDAERSIPSARSVHFSQDEIFKKL